MDTDGHGHRLRVLLAEDDQVSREFLAEALQECGALVDACADGYAALERARTQQFDVLLFDHHLPGLGGDEVLATLARNAAATPPPAIAITAEPDADRAALLDAGFAEILPKPMSVADLRAALRRHVAGACVLDDDDALRACGSRDAVARLRRMFVELEIPAVMAEVQRCSDAPHELRPTLHRLRASCGFCGARALAQASAKLHRSLADEADVEHVQGALAAFLAALAGTRTALSRSLDGDA